jgi:hypothetical protein
VDWTVGAISDGGAYDPINNKVKFGPFFESAARTFTYEITPSTSSTGIKTFTGAAAADTTLTAIAGDTSIDTTKNHPADNAPSDSKITALEVTSYGGAWKKGTAWPTGPNPIPASYVTRAGALWKGGEGYKVDPTVSQPPLWWVNLTRQSHISGLATITDAAKRVANARFVPGVPLDVKINVTPPAGTSTYVVEETVPLDWQVSNISDGGFFDEVNRKIKWGLFFDANTRALTYQLTAPVSAHGVIKFDGVVSFDGMDVSVVGGLQTVAASKLGSLVKGPNNRFTLNFDGSAGKDFGIEVSNDLINWKQIGKLRNENGHAAFSDDDMTSKKQTFYRAVELP